MLTSMCVAFSNCCPMRAVTGIVVSQIVMIYCFEMIEKTHAAHVVEHWQLLAVPVYPCKAATCCAEVGH